MYIAIALRQSEEKPSNGLVDPGHRPLTRKIIEPDKVDEKLAGGGSGPTIFRFRSRLARRESLRPSAIDCEVN